MPDGLNTRPTPALPMPEMPLARWFAERLGVTDAAIVTSRLLPGGAVQHNWRIDLNVDGVAQSYVLRAGPDLPLPESLSKADEFEILCRVHGAGAPVAEPLWFCEGDTPFFISRLCSGDARREILTGQLDNDALLRDLAAALAGIHRVAPDAPVNPAVPSARIDTLAAWLDGIAELSEPVDEGLSNGLAWLGAQAPDACRTTLVHRDFRTGNFLVNDGHLVAVLDWEFAGWGDPHEDIGWFCAQCWRGDALTREAGGLGDRDAFYEAYVAAGGDMPDLVRVRFWEVFAHLRWAIIALQQGARARAGAHPAWELEEAEARVPGLLRTVAEMTR
ncbi:MAG: phosphotransferase family protein [Rhodospirillaceae bacterium]|nr:phosphotransferase family protein [Rhodospirillaceae bacterium]MBT5945573.1 phosphotransferase family protein [Rhodospirillaceae bacterium]MBT6403799.1 phosphotransferase family protein [Rhodospirillaceae bacterium]MBT6536154.1 phosphotransferase family protein [Rhodospirillaceae bacterium]MBT7360586.1 phosphotransferase family protein [Rhodospirillaceae bacterium]